MSLKTYPGFHMYLGTGWNTAKGTRAMLSGAIQRLVVRDYAMTAAEIRAAGK